MAAAAASQQPIDLSKPANYSIRLGSSILKSQSASKPYVGVRYNHKPPSIAKNASARIAPQNSNGNKSIKLDIRDGQYIYGGTATQDVGDQCVLILKGQGEKKEAVLEKVQNGYDFNLQKTPDDSNGDALRERYPHIQGADHAETDGLFGDEADEEEPLDPTNPFDYRHHLKAALAEQAKRPTASAQPSATSTPVVQPRAATTTPVTRPTHKRQSSTSLFTQQQKKRKPLPTSSSATSGSTNKRAKAGQDPHAAPPPRTTNPSETRPHTAAAPTAPEIRLDRKASIARRPSHDHGNDDADEADDDGGGELILENSETSAGGAAKKLGGKHGGGGGGGNSAMSLALSGQLGAQQGPISLRSAASSPASHMASPAPPGREAEEQGGEFELGGDDSLEEERQEARGHGEELEDEEEQDADVEDLELPGPAAAEVQAPPPAVDAMVDVGEQVEEEDDLDAQLAAAMAEEDTGGVEVAAQDESEESEEE